MAISLEEILDLSARYHHLVGVEKGDAAAQAAFFIHPDPIIFVEHASDLTLQANYEIHQGMTGEEFLHLEPWNVTQLSEEPERARATGGVHWQGQPIGGEEHGRIKVVVGEDWIVQRVANRDVKFALYINTHHQLLPDSAPFSLP
jgi:hypothetical protein